MMTTTAESFIPPSGRHDPTCEFLCKDVKPTCVHACKVCDAKKLKEGKGK